MFLRFRAPTGFPARCYSFTNRYAQLVHVVIATTGFAFGEPQPTGSHCTPVGRTATILRRLTGHPRFDFPSQTCPAAGLVTDTGHLLHIPEDFTIRFWIPRGRVNASAARFPASDFFCGQNVAGSNVERLDDPATIAIMPAVDSPDVSCCLKQFCFCHDFTNTSSGYVFRTKHQCFRTVKPFLTVDERNGIPIASPDRKRLNLCHDVS